MLPQQNNFMFQFHKVRLKASWRARSNSSFLFQFHKVRLKADAGFGSNSSATPFQFHKVRLKVLKGNRKSAGGYKVSIPQGTIKRYAENS